MKMKIFHSFSLVCRGIKVAAGNLNPNPFPFTLLPCSSSPKGFSSVSSPSNPIIANYLGQALGFSQTLADSISKRCWRAKSSEKAECVVLFLRDVGFSEAHIRRTVRAAPMILSSDVDKTLKPKIEFFQQLGIVGADLGKLISPDPTVLTCSLHKKLVPCVEIIKKMLSNHEKNVDIIRVLRRCPWVLARNPKLLLSNIEFLQSSGIVGSQLSMLLTVQPRVFTLKQSTLKDLITRAVDLGFSIESRMFVHGLFSVSSLSDDTFRKKFELFQRWGFTEQECIVMLRRAAALLRVSKEKLELGMGFFMNFMKLEKKILVQRPIILTFSIENRIIPRHKVLQVLKSKRLLKKEPRFVTVLTLTDEEFLNQFILRYADNVEELLVAYEGHRSG